MIMAIPASHFPQCGGHSEGRDRHATGGAGPPSNATGVRRRGVRLLNESNWRREMESSLHVVCPHCDTINRVPRARLEQAEGGGGRCGQCRQALFDGHPAALDTARFERHLEKSGVPLLVDFWAPWCGPCRAMAPEFERAAPLLEPRVRLVKVNIDEETVLAQRFQVRSVPTLLLALGGRELARAAGARSAAQLVEWTRKALAQTKV
jgi:thioredoxin 2